MLHTLAILHGLIIVPSLFDKLLLHSPLFNGQDSLGFHELSSFHTPLLP